MYFRSHLIPLGWEGCDTGMLGIEAMLPAGAKPESISVEPRKGTIPLSYNPRKKVIRVKDYTELTDNDECDLCGVEGGYCQCFGEAGCHQNSRERR